MTMSYDDENRLAKLLSDSAKISSDQFIDSLTRRPDPDVVLSEEAYLETLPVNVFRLIMQKVGKREHNPVPPYATYLAARNHDHSQHKPADPEYAVKNLMMLRRVSKEFERVINDMTPGIDYDWVMIGVKFQGFRNNRAITFYKYGGTGSKKPATRLSRIRRFNEFDYEHVQKFERVRELTFFNIPLTQDLFDAIYRMDLKDCAKITFERIPYIDLGAGVDVPTFIQQFLLTVDTRANVFFNSNVFDPNVYLFDQGVKEPQEILEEREAIVRAETEIGKKHRHSKIRIEKKYTKDPNTAAYRDQRTMNVVSQVLLNHRHNPLLVHKYGTKEGHEFYKKQLASALRNKTKKHSPGIRKASRWHFKKIFSLLDRKACHQRKRLLYHLTNLKRLSGEEPMLTAEEEKSILIMNQMKNVDNVLTHFPFLHKFWLPNRYFPIEEKP